MKQDVIYITGHQHPDTDSIAAAIGYAFFKRANGIKAVPCRLGKLGTETKYLLDRFGFPEPMLLDDARVRMSEVEVDEPTTIMPEQTIFEAIQLMHGSRRQTCGVVDEEGRVVGMLTLNDIGLVAMSDTADTERLLEDITPEQINTALSGDIIYRAPDRHIRGRVSVISITKEDLAIHDVQDKIVVTGDDPEAQKHLIEMGAGILIVVRAKQIRPEVLDAAKANGCSVIMSGHSTMNTSRYTYFAPPVSKIMATKVVKFYENEFAEDVGTKMMQTRFHAYPIVDDQNRIVGCASRYHIMNSKNKKIILVDHNEFSQSVHAIEKAEVLEVIDHHRINDFSTQRPVAFRNEIIGSTATIVATMFRENQIPIPQNLAGLLLGAILSDTLKFQSPTTTEKDKRTADILAAIADLDIDEFAADMFSVGADIKGKSITELLNQDIKYFEIEGCRTMVSQVIISTFAALQGMQEQIQSVLDDFTQKKNLDLCLMVFTSILDNGSVVYRSGEKSGWGLEAFPDKENETHSLQKGILSRKSQIIPMLTSTIKKYS
ncbi:MAG: putative manganese-dependent inorganic diphosphatase [Eubacteriales bacterium]|nr:putative manganese-dependent inorganic diphosphatase [Sarcina sp.]MBR2729341.1 putative manganese-dependent inorganic diphosphatase [Lachnospiraceae bacterium]MDO4417484.1 putative manganese-dependent inorganic diphosphatase [Eubacteriales bacterium]